MSARHITFLSDNVQCPTAILIPSKKHTLKKLSKDCCTKNTFTFNNVNCEYIDGVSIGLCLRPTIAKIIMTHLEIKVVDSLFKDGSLKLYIRYVDDTLSLIKESDIDNVLSKRKGFHPSLNFTVNKFDEDVAHYLDLKIIT